MAPKGLRLWATSAVTVSGPVAADITHNHLRGCRITLGKNAKPCVVRFNDIDNPPDVGGGRYGIKCSAVNGYHDIGDNRIDSEVPFKFRRK